MVERKEKLYAFFVYHQNYSAFPIHSLPYFHVCSPKYRRLCV